MRPNLLIVCLFGFDLLSLCTTLSIDSAKFHISLCVPLVTDTSDTSAAPSGPYPPSPGHCQPIGTVNLYCQVEYLLSFSSYIPLNGQHKIAS